LGGLVGSLEVVRKAVWLIGRGGEGCLAHLNREQSCSHCYSGRRIRNSVAGVRNSLASVGLCWCRGGSGREEEERR